MKFNLSKIGFSRPDIKRGLKLPAELDKRLAEDIGIMIGDGHIGIYKYKNQVDYPIYVSGNALTDLDYIKNHVRKLKFDLYNLNFPFSFAGKKRTEIRLKLRSKGLIKFYNKIIGLPLNRKNNIRIPSLIMNSSIQIKCAFIRGLADTDFTITFRKKHKNIMYYPLIKIKTESKNLIKNLKEILDNFSFKTTVSYDLKSFHSITKKYYIGHELSLNGKDNLEKWMKLIKSNNSKNILKYNLWKKQGFCPRDEEIKKMMKDMGPRGFEFRRF